jgi:dihydroorotate dehydrogenase electron transfer subunit
MLNSTILHNTPIASGIFEMVLQFDGGVREFQPGQFAHVRLPGSGPMLLRRPISLNHIDAQVGSATLVYQVKGEGTKLLSSLGVGERLDVLAPLGRGFWRPEGLKKAALVGGGIGAAPLRMLPEAWPDVVFDAYLGFRGEQLAYQVKEFTALMRNVSLCSDDGTMGERTFVTCLLDRDFCSEEYDALFACGPVPMLKALKTVLDGSGIPCQASLEERMGCGVGACLVCSCKIQEGDGWHYKRVCKDGPVFDLGEVDFHGQA